MKNLAPNDLSKLPVLTQAVQLNNSLRPAMLPWQVPTQVQDVISQSSIDQNLLADKVIEQVQGKIAELMPELLKESVDQVLREHALEQLKVKETDGPSHTTTGEPIKD